MGYPQKSSRPCWLNRQTFHHLIQAFDPLIEVLIRASLEVMRITLTSTVIRWWRTPLTLEAQLEARAS